MENTSPANTTKSESKWTSPLAIIGILWLCAAGFSILTCVGTVWYARQGGTIPLLPTAVPTVNIVEETTADPAWRLIIEDNFDNNANEWPVSAYENDNVQLNRTVANGIYTWDFQAKNGWNFYGYPELKQMANLVVSAEFKHTQGSLFDSYGFLLRSSGGNYYYFQINESGSYDFGYYYLEEYTTLLEGRTNQIRPGLSNQLTVKASGTHFTLYVNNTPIGEVDNAQLTTGWVGLLLSPSGLSENGSRPQGNETPTTAQPSKFEVDNFKIWIAAETNTARQATPLPPLDPDNGTLVFVTSQDGSREIFTIRTDGQDLNRLTNNPADDYSPTWSPNGRRIAFVSTREGNPDIFVMNRDGSEITRLTDTPSDDLDPSWSPDGKQIVFSSAQDGQHDLYILDVETKSVEQLTDGEGDDRHPDWSPDGKTILFQSDRDFGVNFYSIDVETKKIKRITFDTTSSSAHPSWSPNGLFYIYEKTFGGGGVGLVIKEYPNKNPFTVVGAYLEFNSWPAWSPDGTQIAYVSNSDKTNDIYIINKDGTAIYRLTTDSMIESELDWTAE